jgi:hypothetical protein
MDGAVGVSDMVFSCDNRDEFAASLVSIRAFRDFASRQNLAFRETCE